jgi:hypothetical protein
MARYLVATHRSTETRDWLCAHCHASGHTTVEARGHGKKRLWFSRGAAADIAHELAAVDLERDADRIVALIRCPKCRERAPRAVLATLWYGLGDLWLACIGAFFAAILVGTKTDSFALIVAAAAVVFVVVLAIGDERRRWKEAARAQIQLTQSRRSIAVQRAPVDRGGAALDADPYRAPPDPPRIVVVRPPIDTHAPIVADHASAEPTFLTSRTSSPR